MSNGTFVIFGNARRPFVRMVNALLSCTSELPAPIVVQAGVNAKFFTDASPNMEVFDRCGEVEFHKKLEGAKIVITHAGVGGIKDCQNYGKYPAVFVRKMAYNEHIDDHQAEFCEVIKVKDWGVVVDDAADLSAFINGGRFASKNTEQFLDDGNLKSTLQCDIRRLVGLS